MFKIILTITDILRIIMINHHKNNLFLIMIIFLNVPLPYTNNKINCFKNRFPHFSYLSIIFKKKNTKYQIKNHLYHI